MHDTVEAPAETTPSDEPSRNEKPKTSPSLLRHRDFGLLTIGQTTSQLGSQVSAVALPLVAVAMLHATPLQTGLLGAASTIAFAIIGLPAGAWVDRIRRRPVLIAADLARGLLLVSLPVAAALGVLTIGQLLVVALAIGFARVFFDVAYPSYLPSLVGRDKLLQGNSTLEAIRATGQVAGPGLGGFLVGLFSAVTVIWVDAVSYFASAASLVAIRTREPVPAVHEKAGFRAQIREGLSYVIRQPVLRAIALTGAMCNIAFNAVGAVLFIFLVRELHLPAGVIGLVVSVGSVAAMLGAMAAPRLARRFGSARIVWLSLAVTAPFTLLVPLTRPGWGLALFVVGSTLSEFGQIIYAITNVSLRQTLCPDRMLGRMNATMRVLIMGAIPLGSIIGGALGELLGIRPALWIITPLLVLSWVPLVAPLRGIRDVADLKST